MKKISLIFLFLCAVNISYAGISGSGNWYKFFKGKVGSLPATLTLIKYDSSVSGYMYLDKDVQPARLIGDARKDSLLISAYTLNSSFENIDGVLKKGVYSGWCSIDNLDKKVEFMFTEDPSVSDMFDFEYVSGEKKLISTYSKSPAASYREGVIWPSSKYNDYEYARKVISGIKKFPANMRSVNSELERNMKKTFGEYMEDNKGVTKKELEGEEYTSSYNMEIEDILIPAYFDKNVLVFSEMSYSYTGGAHGNYGTSYMTYDLKNKKQIKPEDILNSEGINMLPKLLEKYFRKQFEVADTSTLVEAGLFTDTISVNDNICLTPGSLMFCYVPYEIGPYAMGEVSIFIPINEIESYLKPEMKSLLK